MQNFYTSFSNGGWIEYGAYLRPDHNAFGGLIIASDFVSQKAAQAANAATHDALAGGGFLSIAVCSDGTRPKKYMQTNYDPATKTYVQQGKEVDRCPDGKPPHASTPGGAVAATLYSGLDSPFKQLVNAQDWTLLVSAVVDSFLNTMIQDGLAVIKNQNSTNHNDNTTISPKCAKLQGSAREACINSGGTDFAGLTGSYNSSAGKVTKNLPSTGDKTKVPPYCKNLGSPQAEKACAKLASNIDAASSSSIDTSPEVSSTLQNTSSTDATATCGTFSGQVLLDCNAAFQACAGKTGEDFNLCAQAAQTESFEITNKCSMPPGIDRLSCIESHAVCHNFQVSNQSSKYQACRAAVDLIKNE
jgi:hypothetical protein